MQAQQYSKETVGTCCSYRVVTANEQIGDQNPCESKLQGTGTGRSSVLKAAEIRAVAPVQVSCLTSRSMRGSRAAAQGMLACPLLA